MESQAAGGYFDLKLVPEYDDSGTQSVVEWLEKLEFVCKLRGLTDVARVIPLHLSGGAFAMHLQLDEDLRKSKEEAKEALLAAFAVDPYERPTSCSSLEDCELESPDVYLAELQRLASLFGGMTDKALACAFVAGLPESARSYGGAGLAADSGACEGSRQGRVHLNHWRRALEPRPTMML